MAKRANNKKAISFRLVRREFGQWRSTRRRGARIPERLWAAAVDLAREHGVSRTIRELRLDYYALKRRVDGEEKVSPRVDTAQNPSFVELPMSVPAKRSCTLELQNNRGTALRMELSGMSVEEVVAVVHGLWGGNE